MIKRLNIKNFQVHESLKIDFDPKITTIVGPSDIGKSAIIRAIKWIIFNKPSGDAFIKEGKKNTTVELDIDNHIIKRIKGDQNLYSCNDINFTAFGNNVPSEISNLLNLSDINFQNQYDNPFWFNETAGEVSRQLNQIVNLEIIDDSLSQVASLLKTGRIEVDIIQKRLLDLKVQRKELKYIQILNLELEEIEKTQEKIHIMEKQYENIIKIIEQAKVYKQMKVTYSQAYQDGTKMIRARENYKNIKTQTEKLTENLNNYQKCIEIKNREIPDISPLEKLAEKIKLNTERKSQISNQIEMIINMKEKLCEKQKMMNYLNQKFQKEIGKICPLCGNQIQ